MKIASVSGEGTWRAELFVSKCYIWNLIGFVHDFVNSFDEHGNNLFQKCVYFIIW